MLARNDLIVIDDDTRLSVRVIDDTNWDLQIKNVDSTDSGNYMCMIQMMPPQIKYVSLTVNGMSNKLKALTITSLYCISTKLICLFCFFLPPSPKHELNSLALFCLRMNFLLKK